MARADVQDFSDSEEAQVMGIGEEEAGPCAILAMRMDPTVAVGLAGWLRYGGDDPKPPNPLARGPSRKYLFYPPFAVAAEIAGPRRRGETFISYLLEDGMTATADATLLTLRLLAACWGAESVNARKCRYLNHRWLLGPCTGLPLSVVRRYVDPEMWLYGNLDDCDGGRVMENCPYALALGARDPAWGELALGYLREPRRNKSFFSEFTVDSRFRAISNIGARLESKFLDALLIGRSLDDVIGAALTCSRGPLLHALVDRVVSDGRAGEVGEHVLTLLPLAEDTDEPGTERLSAVLRLASALDPATVTGGLALAYKGEYYEMLNEYYRDCPNRYWCEGLYEALMAAVARRSSGS